MVILIGGQKGGTGKSTIATNIVTCLANKKKKVLLIDANSAQGTASNWSLRREETELAQITCIEKSGNIYKTVKNLADKYDYVVIDTGGQDSKEFRTAMVAVNLIITPVRASQADVETLIYVADLIEQAREMNPNLKAKVLITNAPTNPKIRSVEDTKDLIKKIKEMKLAKTVIYHRKAYSDAIPAGAGVIELDDKKAINEIKSLVREMFR